MSADGVDVIVGQMIGGVYNAPIVQRWWRRLANDAGLVYELDDDPFNVEPHNPAYGEYGSPVRQDSITRCIQVADLVTASTDVLAQRIRRLNPNVVVLQNRIDENVLQLIRPRCGRLTIGWAGGVSHLNDIKECAYGLRRALDRHDVEAHFIGADFRRLIARPVRYTPWCDNTTDYYRLIDFDIGLAPLAPTVFSESKSHIKALEYAALGIPVIASDVAAYRNFVVDGVTGWLVRREHEWASRLRQLICDEEMRREMGTNARELAADWTIQHGWQEWESAYQSVL
ncbi:MAG: glycosyltransferase [Mycobacterium sp.]